MPTASQKDLRSCISADCVFTFCSMCKIYAMCLLCRLLMFFAEETEDIDRNKMDWHYITAPAHLDTGAGGASCCCQAENILTDLVGHHK